MTSQLSPVERAVFCLRLQVLKENHTRYTQKEVAQLIECSPSTVRRLERVALTKIPAEFGA